jgi:protein TonB
MVTPEVQTREVTPVVQHAAKRSASQPSQRMVTRYKVQQASVHPVEARAIETASVMRDSDLPASSAPATAAASDAKPAEPVVRESAPQVAMATRSTPAVKADYGWLAESLRRRLAEIKRYPSAARLNGWEGASLRSHSC